MKPTRNPARSVVAAPGGGLHRGVYMSSVETWLDANPDEVDDELTGLVGTTFASAR
jgi:hypothetical protein